MKIIPLIFNQQMVQALVDGRKTVTRRPIRYFRDSSHWSLRINENRLMQSLDGGKETPTGLSVPFKVGDLIWVRETFCLGRFDEVDAEHPDDRELIIDQCTGDDYYIARQFAYEEGATELDEVKWKPSIHMPRKASRLTLRVSHVRCERIHQMTKMDAINEGFDLSNLLGFPRLWFRDVWNSLYSNWDENPWVWVIEFEVIKSNVDEVAL